ncbi:hypothetical protein Ddye_001160 [Dipteronia dyeriana]|uniref:Remorin C-terminal domain-containing protein n=1 Tax=Dipteronia dyeriana TaxID=168575 RepID=A0AAD9XNK3_9ROSI|nr:hypothetical protein Ddye_001160 [Dipteronia dyeriana]
MGWRTFFKMQSARKTSSQDRDPSNIEFATAVLAAAFAIHSLEQEAKPPQTRNSNVKIRKVVQAGINQVTRRPSYNNTKIIAGETSTRKSTDAWEKVERHEKLKSVLAWANEKKNNAKQKIERTKSESELKIASRLSK